MITLTEEKGIKELYSLLQDVLPGEVIILPHADPDTDAMGASLAWAAYLHKKGQRLRIISSAYINNLNWLPGIANVLVYDPTKNEVEVTALLQSASLICCLDFSRTSRLHLLEPLLDAASAPIFVLDHHLAPQDFSTYLYHSTAVPSTTSLLFQLIMSWGDQALIDHEMATCLYAGLVSDTASFSNTRTSAFAFETAQALLHWNVDTEMVYRQVYGNLDYKTVRLLGYVLHQKIFLLQHISACYILLTAAEIDAFEQDIIDTDVFLRYAINLQDINLAVMLVERADHIKVSVRTVGPISAAEFTRQYFHGGGHRNAAGAVLEQVPMDVAVQLLLKAFEDLYKVPQER